MGIRGLQAYGSVLAVIAALLLALVFSGVLADPAWAQDEGAGSDESAEETEGNDQYGSAVVDCTQIIEQFGGDQTGVGQYANNQEFDAEQVQECQAIVGNIVNEVETDKELVNTGGVSLYTLIAFAVGAAAVAAVGVLLLLVRLRRRSSQG